MNRRENVLRAAQFENPELIPLSFGIGSACWEQYPQDALQELMATHPLLFPDFQKSDARIGPKHPPWRRAEHPYTDSWGCVWETSENGMTGSVVRHALADWSSFPGFSPPHPEEHDGWGPIDWVKTKKRVETAKQTGRLASGSLRHGHTFLTLTYLRGYENLQFDMADENPSLASLIHLVEDFNMGLVQGYVKLGVEWMGYPEDLGMQQGPMLSPPHFQNYIKPTYARLMAPARDAGCVVHMHSDGDIRALAQDLLDVGVNVLNLQDLVNGIDWIANNLKGRVCIDLDIDRQSIVHFGSPTEIDTHIREAVTKLASRQGGLMLKHGLHPGIPLKNVKAVMDAMEKYAAHFS